MTNNALETKRSAIWTHFTPVDGKSKAILDTTVNKNIRSPGGSLEIWRRILPAKHPTIVNEVSNSNPQSQLLQGAYILQHCVV